LEKALFQAKEGRLHILNEMAKTITTPNEDFKDHAPRIVGFTISTEFMGAIIGPGGKVIQELQKETETTIVLEEKSDKIASVAIAGNNKDGIDRAVAAIKGITTVPEAGSVYKGKVKVILDFGAIIEFLPGKEGLLHISEIAHKRIKDVKDELEEGQEVEIKILEIDKRSGKFKLSRKALLPKPENKEKKAESREEA
jgi:polyribonucleotide nucleotidyltransferase